MDYGTRDFKLQVNKLNQENFLEFNSKSGKKIPERCVARTTRHEHLLVSFVL